MLVSSALAPSSQKAYQSAWSKFVSFARSHGLPSSLPVPPEHLLWFCTALANGGLAHSSILPILSAISYFHKLHDVGDSTKDFKLQQLLSSLRRSGASSDSRQPITQDILMKILDRLATSQLSVYERRLFRAMFLTSFNYGLRLGEVSESPHNLMLSSIVMSSSCFQLTFNSFKHSVGPPVTHLIQASASQLCPVSAMNIYLSSRGNLQGPLFILRGAAVKRRVFTARLQSLVLQCGFQIRLTSHSFRIGAATWWAHLNYSEAKIKQLGRWRSNAFLKYLRGPVSHPST